MRLGKVQTRGQITLPRAIRRAAQIEPGDTVTMRVAGPGRLEVTALPRLHLADALARYHIEGPVDDAADRPRWQEKAAGDVVGTTE